MNIFIKQKLVSLYEPLLGPILQGLRQEVCALIEDTVLNEQKCDALSLPYTSILDCCCGAGGFLRILQQNIVRRHNTFCFGLDINPYMLHEAQKQQQKKEAMGKPCSYLIQGDALQLPLSTQSITVATLCMALHTLPAEQGKKLLQELLRVASFVIIADYCLAERNLHLPSACLAHGVEYLVGGEHYASYKIFMAGGALEGFCHTQGLIPLQRRSTLGGAGQILLLHSDNRKDFS